MAGCFRFVCHNGLICGETLEDFRVRHSGDVLSNVIEGAYRIVSEFEQVDAVKQLMQSVQLTPKQQNAFVNSSLTLRYDPEDNIPIVAQQLNQPRRFDDRGNDLWRTFNRVQENLLQGGLQGVNSNGGKMTTRKITGVSENIRLNRALWTLAEEMARLAA